MPLETERLIARNAFASVYCKSDGKLRIESNSPAHDRGKYPHVVVGLPYFGSAVDSIGKEGAQMSGDIELSRGPKFLESIRERCAERLMRGESIPVLVNHNDNDVIGQVIGVWPTARGGISAMLALSNSGMERMQKERLFEVSARDSFGVNTVVNPYGASDPTLDEISITPRGKRINSRVMMQNGCIPISEVDSELDDIRKGMSNLSLDTFFPGTSHDRYTFAEARLSLEPHISQKARDQMAQKRKAEESVPAIPIPDLPTLDDDEHDERDALLSTIASVRNKLPSHAQASIDVWAGKLEALPDDQLAAGKSSFLSALAERAKRHGVDVPELAKAIQDASNPPETAATGAGTDQAAAAAAAAAQNQSSAEMMLRELMPHFITLANNGIPSNMRTGFDPAKIPQPPAAATATAADMRRYVESAAYFSEAMKVAGDATQSLHPSAESQKRPRRSYSQMAMQGQQQQQPQSGDAFYDNFSSSRKILGPHAQ